MESNSERRRRVAALLALALAGALLELVGPVRAAAGDAGEVRCPEPLQEIVVDGEVIGCTHGPDAPPPDDRGEGHGPPRAGTAEVFDEPIQCLGDGVSGRRVQLLYVRASDRPDRFTDVVRDIRGWARGIDGIVRQSAAETGGDRAVRWVTNRDCKFAVSNVVVSPAADGFSFGTTIDELMDRGFTDPRRKYLVFMDADAFCGVGEAFPVDSGGDDPDPATNPNNGNIGRGMFARVDTGCWGADVAAHELMHTLGAVQENAPNATPYGHCEDEYDIMCYVDGPGTTTRVVCPATSHDLRLDCGHDDYFHTAPAPTSYLGTHWNTARSSWLFDPDPPAPVVPGPTSRLRPLPPARVLDTRNGIGPGRTTPLAPGETLDLALAGAGGLPADGFSAVVLNVTVVRATQPGYVTVYPAGQPRPNVSNLNASAGQIVANQVIVPVSAGERISIFDHAGGHLVVDVSGYFEPAVTATGGRLTAMTPRRFLDSRVGIGRPGTAPVTPSSPVKLKVAGVGGVPSSGVSAVVMNVTATQPAGSGFITVHPGGTARPNASNLNVERSGQTIANHVVVPVGADGTVTLYPSVTTHLIADVGGWFGDDSGADGTSGLYRPFAPVRAYDSRQFAKLGAGAVLDLDLVVLGGLPSEADEGVLVANATVTQTEVGGFLTAHPARAARPNASNLNWSATGQTVPNLVTVGADAGRAAFYVYRPTHLVLDLSGYYVP